MTVHAPGSSVREQDMFMLKVSQLVMMGIGFLAIWGGIFSVAFDEEATNENFLVLFVGGLASFAVSIALIELQSKKNDYHLQDIQNYILGIAFFFSTVGVLWGTRYLVAVATGTFELDVFGDPAAYTDTDWSPNANAIYAQTATCLLLTYGHYRLLQRYNGQTSFGWGVATYAPMAILLAGVGPWIRWSNDVVSWELGIAMLSITLVSLEMSLRSNKALNFVVVAFVAGLVPLVYEGLNTNAPVDGTGGALSLMVFIIAIQGYFAAREDLRKEVMERASLFLIGQVVFALFLVRISTNEFNLILGPFRAGDYPAIADYINVPVALWCTVLLAYFPAVLKQRVPWMPIGLAVALLVLPMASSTVPWVLSMLILPYMVFISKVARTWVVNLTMLAFSVSYLLTDWYAYTQDIPAKEAFGGTWLHVLIPVFLLSVAELGRSRQRLQTSISLAMIGSVILSRAILDPEWYLPWLLVAYMFSINWRMLRTATPVTLQHRKDVTLSMIFTTLTVLLLAVLDNLTIPDVAVLEDLTDLGFRPQFLLLSIALYAVSAKARAVELDFGSVLKWLDQGNAAAPTYDAESGTWIVPDAKETNTEEAIAEAAWGPLARLSVGGWLMLFTLSISTIRGDVWASDPYIVLLLVLPVAMLVRDIVQMDTIGSIDRAVGVALLIFLAVPLSWKLNDAGAVGNDVLQAGLLLDAILVAAPFVVNGVIVRRGIDETSLNREADGAMYLMLLGLALLDTSGGLLFLPLAVLVAWRTVLHRYHVLTLLVPLAVLIADIGSDSAGLVAKAIEALPASVGDYLMNNHNGPFPAFEGLLIMVHMTSQLYSMYKTEESEEASGLWVMGSIFWFTLALLSVLPDGYWIPTLVTVLLMPYLYASNRSDGLPFTLGLLFVSLFIGFSGSDTFQPISEGDAAGWSGVLTGAGGCVMAALHAKGMLFKQAPEDEEEQRKQNDVAQLAVQIGGLGFVAGYSVFYGLGPLLGLAILSWSMLRNGKLGGVLLFPLLSTFSIINIMVQSDLGTDDQQTTVAGLALAVQGVMLTLLSAKDDLMYDWEGASWDSDDAFFAFMDRLGLAGLTYSLVGVYVALNTADLESIAYLLMTVYLVIVGVQGFDEENDAVWRRGLGGYGSIFTSFLFANSLESSIFGAIAFVLMGIIALGFGFLFMQRMNEDDGIYVEQETQPMAPVAEPPSLPEQAQGRTDEEDAPPEDTEGASEIEEVLENLDDETGEMAEAVEERPDEAVDADEFEGFEDLVEATALEPPAPRHSGLLSTGEGFSLRLPSDAVEKIIRTLKVTPHDGYLPVVAFGPTGEIMLNFEEA